MCGVLGICGFEDVSSELVNGLISIQHRGQDAAGVLTYNNGRFRMHKGIGHVSQVFQKVDMSKLKGNIGLAHVRYATIGSTEAIDAQPFAVNYPFGIAMVHNGNVINFVKLKKVLNDNFHRMVETANDVELLLFTFAAYLQEKNLANIELKDIYETVEFVQETVKGAYSCITYIKGKGFLAFTDPHGIRPLMLGKKATEKGTKYIFTSETAVFDYLGYDYVRDLEAGEAVFIDMDNKLHSKILKRKRDAFCVFEYIYFAREDSIFRQRLVASERVRMGKALKERIDEAGVKPDIIIDVPNSAYFFASGLAEMIEAPYRRGLAKNRFVGRSFITPTAELRKRVVRQKLNPMKDIIIGRKIAVVDDSIVRGTTSRHIVHMLKEYGAKEVYFVSASPPVKYPCIYGIDMSVKKELIAANNNEEEIAESLGCEKVIYQTVEGLRDLYKDLPICDACFSGDYPTGITQEILDEIEAEKLKSDRM
ncbi:MAG: amidophosphoribosyltransferase [Candidatus Marinimicrobia bacterium]|nr:amidophosphoribosyltransferase [Candidatus Neomarinimicrobiota bacterium]